MVPYLILDPMTVRFVTLALGVPLLALLPIALMTLPTILLSTDRNIQHGMSFTGPHNYQEYAPSRGVIEDLRTVSGEGELQCVICIHTVML